MIQAAAIIPAAGSGTRMQASLPKQYLELSGRPVLIHSIAAFDHCAEIERIVIAVAADRLDSTRRLLEEYRLGAKTEVIAGGRRRQDSVRAGLDQLGDDIDIVLVHDGARPLVAGDVIRRCLDEAGRSGAAIAAVPVKDTLKRGDTDRRIAATVDRDGLWQAQTPQAVRLSLLRRAFAAAGDVDVTDEAMLLEIAGIPVSLVMGSESNIKITRPEDLIMAEKLLGQADPAPPMRIGHGFDAHRLAKERRLVLGGVEIDHHRGLAGHSDADVVTHAVCDAILGALGLGDIGSHFPDSAAEYKDIYSILLLERVCATMRGHGFSVGNLDITVVCQQPKLAPYIDAMRRTLAAACAAEPSRLNIKATTTEKMGYTGREEGIGCHAVALLTAQPPKADNICR